MIPCIKTRDSHRVEFIYKYIYIWNNNIISYMDIYIYIYLILLTNYDGYSRLLLCIFIFKFIKLNFI